MRLALESVCMRFGSVAALDDVGASFAPGTATVLVGPNGAGKSTLFGVLLGLVRPQRGVLDLDGERVDLSRHAVPFSLRRRLGYLPEAVAFAESLSGKQVLSFFARARGVPLRRVPEALERVGLAAAARRPVRGYSRGMRQRLGLAVATVSEPELLVLDEPTGGLDQEGLALLWTLLREWRAAGRTVVLSSHDLTLVERRIDRVVVLSEGRVIAEGSPDDLRQRVDLPVRVRFSVEDPVHAGLLEARFRERFADARVEREGSRLTIAVGEPLLLDVIRGVNGEGAQVRATRVEEPGLDEVYERLLSEARR